MRRNVVQIDKKQEIYGSKQSQDKISGESRKYKYLLIYILIRLRSKIETQQKRPFIRGNKQRSDTQKVWFCAWK